MTDLFVGLDISKGYLDAVAIDQTGRTLFSERCDDTAAGHAVLTDVLLTTLANSTIPPRVHIGMESSGGYERNWARWARGQQRTLAHRIPVKVFVLNPLAVKRFLARELHRTTTDRSSALGIAQYLAGGMRAADVPYEETPEGAVTLYRLVASLTAHTAGQRAQLATLLVRIHPELVQYCRNGIPGWILTLVKRYPTARQLAGARPATLERIPYLTLSRARQIIEAAKESVASMTDVYAQESVRLLASELLHAKDTISVYKKRLITSFAQDPAVLILASITGIGDWSAICLRLELGTIDRFRSSAALVSFFGLDPVVVQSGDMISHRGISKRGRAQLRAILFPCANAAIRHNPVIAAFYQRLIERGKKPKVAIVACMRKMVELIYACSISGKPFDVQRWQQHLERVRDGQQRTNALQQQATTDERAVEIAASLDAPISRREAQKRKATTVPQASYQKQIRGLGAASRIIDSGG